MKTRLRAMAVSLSTASFEVVLFALCTLLLVGGRALLVARWVCGAVGGIANFLLNRVWAFGASETSPWAQAGRYALAALLAVTLATSVWWLIRTLTGWDPRLVHVLSMALVWVAVTFPLLHRWVFARATN